MIALLRTLWSKPIVQATLERMVRGGIAAVAAAYVAGDLVLSIVTVDTVHQVVAIFISGAVASLLMALGITSITKTGPAINKAEAITPPKTTAKNQGGYVQTSYLATLLFAAVLGACIGTVLYLLTR